MMPGGERSLAHLAEDAIAVAGKVNQTQQVILAQQARAKRNLRLIIVSVILDVALSVSLILVAVNQSSVTAQIHRSQLQACAIGNSFRAGQVQLWNHVIAVSAAPPHETAAERKARLARLAAFRAYIARQFRPVDCARLYRN